MKIFFIRFCVCVASVGCFFSCETKVSSHEEMVRLLDQQRRQYNQRNNYYASAPQVAYYDSLITATESAQDKMLYTYSKCYALIALGREEEAISLLEEQVLKINKEGINGMDKLKVQLALAYLRAGERINCIKNHSAETCILPIRGAGIHTNQTGSRNAIRIYEELLKKYPDNLEYRWLLNIGYMTLGSYPQDVPPDFLIPDLSRSAMDDTIQITPFQDIANVLQLDVNNMAGGTVIDDFNNDGYLDIVTSSWDLDEPMHYFENNQTGGFTDRSKPSRLGDLTGGLNIMQMDYNNDGFKDIFVLRGAWLRGHYGLQPNSLVRNNGDGTFTDVTTESGLLSFHPTQTATWNDFNNDGWVDVFIGNESWEGNASSGLHPCELYINNQNGSFTNIAESSGCNVTGFIKGVTSGDYNNDGWKDIFISSLSGNRYLLKNNGVINNVPSFEDVTKQSKLDDGFARTFPTWFWDYNNDGWLDILVGDFTFDKPISSYSAAEGMNVFTGTSGTIFLYQNNHDGTFLNVSQQTGIAKPAFAMSGNFGDIDNDGFLDFYLGTGNPELESIVPNKMFKNIGGVQFVDVTTPARVGHLQKGHAITFADLDQDGDQDIYLELGGAYKGDAFHNSLYLNPGQDKDNNWITLDLVRKDHLNVIGTSIKITCKENGVVRTIYREVNSGGSFGASPLRKEIGIGRATMIDEIAIRWHSSTTTQYFKNVKPNQILRIKENADTPEAILLNVLHFEAARPHHHH